MGCGTSRNSGPESVVRRKSSVSSPGRAKVRPTQDEKDRWVKEGNSKKVKESAPKENTTATTTVVSAARLLSADAGRSVVSIFGSREKQSAYSKKIPPEDLEFIEQPGGIKTEEQEVGTRTGSRETQKTRLSVESTRSGHLPPISSKRNLFRSNSRSSAAVSLPNVIGTPVEGLRRSAGSMERRKKSSERRSWSLSSEDEIINHWRPPSTSSLPSSPSNFIPPPLTPPPAHLNFPFNHGKRDRKSVSSESSSFIFVQRKVRVAWEGGGVERKREEVGDDGGGSVGEQTISSKTSASCSTCGISSSNTVSQSGVESETPNDSDTDSSQKISVLPEDSQTEQRSDSNHQVNSDQGLENEENKKFQSLHGKKVNTRFESTASPSGGPDELHRLKVDISTKSQISKQEDCNFHEGALDTATTSYIKTAEAVITPSPAVRKSRSGTALARLKQIRQLSLPSFSFVRKSLSPRGSPDTVLPSHVSAPSPIKATRESGETKRPITAPLSSESKKERRRFFRSRTIDFASIKKSNASGNSKESRRKDAASVSPNRRQRIGPSLSSVFTPSEGRSSDKSRITSTITGRFQPKIRNESNETGTTVTTTFNQKITNMQAWSEKADPSGKRKKMDYEADSLSGSDDHFEFGEDEIEITLNCPTVFHEFFNDFPSLFDDVLDADDVISPPPIPLIGDKFPTSTKATPSLPPIQRLTLKTA